MQGVVFAVLVVKTAIRNREAPGGAGRRLAGTCALRERSVPTEVTLPLRDACSAAPSPRLPAPLRFSLSPPALFRGRFLFSFSDLIFTFKWS
jgi:hypothetical protein